jgi:tetratricopeptide (TPR) repeat protein
MNMYGLALALSYTWRHEEAIAWFKNAFRLDPIPLPLYIFGLGESYFNAKRYGEALAEFKRVLERAKKGEYNISGERSNGSC